MIEAKVKENHIYTDKAICVSLSRWLQHRICGRMEVMLDNKKSKIGALIIGAGLGVGINTIIKKYCGKNKMEESVVSANRFEVGFHIFNRWMMLKNEGKTLRPFFEDNEISTVAIYGMGALGERLLEELEKLDIKVVYAIDRIANSKAVEGLKIVGAEDLLEEADAIIVTPVQDFYAIEQKLELRTDADIISLEDIVDYCV